MDYFTIADFAETTFTEKRSEFIGYLAPVLTNDEAVGFINDIRAQHRKAKHHVYAYILRDSNITRYSDDGEPQGTAGVPVLDVLQKRGLTDVCCVVVRYFGGILLGGGGLVRAYSHSAALTCDAASILHMCESCPLSLRMDYTLYGKVTHILPEYGVIESGSEFGTEVWLVLQVRLEVLDRLMRDLTELSNGRIHMECGKTGYADFSAAVKKTF